MPARPPPDTVAAVQHFKRGGVAPALIVTRAMRSSKTLSQLFATDLAEGDWRALPEPPMGWQEMDLGSGERVLAFCRYRSLAYRTARGSIDEHRAAARSLLDALAVQRIWSNSNLHATIDTTRFTSSGHAWTNLLTSATFEQTVVLVGAVFATLVVWTDED